MLAMLVALASSQGPTPSKGSEGKQAPVKQSNAPNDFGKNAPKLSAPVQVVAEGHAADPDRKSPQDNPPDGFWKVTLSDLIVAVSTVFIAVFAGVQVRVLRQQRQKMEDAVAEARNARADAQTAAKETADIARRSLDATILAAEAAKFGSLAAKEQADTSIRALELAERPWLAFSAELMVSAFGQPVDIIVTATNVGKTPAFMDVFGARWFVGEYLPEDQANDIINPLRDKAKSSGAIVPGMPVRISPGLAPQQPEGSHRYIICVAEYRDTFGTPHETSTAWICDDGSADPILFYAPSYCKNT